MKKFVLITLVLVMTICLLSGQGSAQTINFDTNDGGFTVVNSGSVENPWRYTPGSWYTDGTSNIGSPTSSGLISPTFTVFSNSSVDLSFDHRYNIEEPGYAWDGGQVQVKINGGAWAEVPLSSFTQNGYTGTILGNNVLNGKDAYYGVSSGYSTPNYITSIATLGNFSASDTFQIQFLAAWDEYEKGSEPNWQVDSLQLTNVVNPVPIPSALLLLASGLIGLTGFRKKYRS
jgi:hypothetical protein